MDHLGIMANNSRTVVDLLGCLLTVLSNDVFTLLNVGCIDNGLAHWPRDLLGLVFWDLVAHLLNMLLTLRGRAVTFMSISAISSISLVISSMSITTIATMSDNTRVMTNYMRAFVDLEELKIEFIQFISIIELYIRAKVVSSSGFFHCRNLKIWFGGISRVCVCLLKSIYLLLCIAL